MSLNKALLIGRLGKDPELTYTNTGTAKCKFSLASSEKYKNQQGELQERTEWHNIVAWGKLAEICGQYLQKGKQVYIEGRIETRSWEDNSGQKRWITEIVSREVKFLGDKNEGQQQQQQQQQFGGQGQWQQQQQQFGGHQYQSERKSYSGQERQAGTPNTGSKPGEWQAPPDESDIPF